MSYFYLDRYVRLTYKIDYVKLINGWILKGGELAMVSTYENKDEQLETFVESAKSEYKEELTKMLELQRLLEEIGVEAQQPQVYRISVRSNW